MAIDQVPGIQGERSLREGDVDRLGFAEVADRIASAIVDRASAEGLVIGLDGEWGSGKSSLLHLIERSLRSLPEAQQPSIISFRPWLLGKRDALLAGLFGELAEKIAAVASARGDGAKATVQKAKQTAETVRRFARALGRAGEFIEAGEVIFVPLGTGGRFLRGLGTLAEQKKEDGEEERDLAALKDKITADLRTLGHRFIVTVDDVDRLEPEEVLEVLRLVRSVADFPNVVYVLCYDIDRLAEAIESSANIDDGIAFLEKIIQLTVMVPKPEPFELRQWFSDEVSSLVGPLSPSATERLLAVIDQEGGNQLRTPRSVVRTLDSLRFFWPALRDEAIDIADLVWLQLIKDGSPSLYRWIETYVASVAATSFGTATVTESSIASRLKALHEAVPDDHFEDRLYRQFFSDILPGIEAALGDDEAPVKIHEKVSPADRQAAIAGRRLASPDHYRLYFSLIGPKHAVPQLVFDRFWAAAAAADAGEVADILKELHAAKSFGSLRKSDVLFERLRETDPTLVTSCAARTILLALARVMDDIHREGDARMLLITTANRAERLRPMLFGRLDAGDRALVVGDMFANGAAIEWLTDILRRETFAHGRYGNRKKPEREWLLSDAELDEVAAAMIARYRKMSVADVLATPSPLNLLFGWSQAGDEDGPRELMAKAIESDSGLIAILDRMTSLRETSDRGQFPVLKSDNVEPFLDFGAVRKRLETIAAGSDEDLAASARALLGAAKQAEDW